jgi:nicotinate-nucleotide pyrophosphorylase (carboxylating)
VELDFGCAEQSAADVLIAAALREDLQNVGDLTCLALIDADEQAAVYLVARQDGVLAGLPIAERVFQQLDSAVRFDARLSDGARLEPGSVVAEISGPLRSLLTGERTALNFLTHLSGVATLTSRFVAAVANTKAQILDTRKTLPGWRVLEKYAVRAGGGTNHRLGLYDGILIKDNHLAAWAARQTGATIADAVRQARQAVEPGMTVEVEVDTLDQLTEALPGTPDIVLLDNMDLATLRAAVALRDSTAPGVLLEASGSVSLETVSAIADTGVERISVGALTHSAPALDLALDWKLGE